VRDEWEELSVCPPFPHVHEVDDQEHILRANERFRVLLRTPRREARESGPHGRVVERDMTPALAHVCDSDPTQLVQV
jgi:hypothetical protein